MTQPGVELFTERTPRVVAARRLLRRRHRDAERKFLVEGAQAVFEALTFASETISRPQVAVLFATPAALGSHASLLSAATERGVLVNLVTDEAIASLSETITPQGLVAVCSYVDVPLPQLLNNQLGLVVIATEVRDPGNAGALMRVADAAGVAAVIFTNESVDPYNGKCVRASTGSLFHLPIVRGGEPVQVMETLRAAGLQLFATSGHGGIDLFEVQQSRMVAPTAWIFGNEAHGLSPELYSYADLKVTVPVYGHVESLNLVMAAAICLYESARATRE